MGSYKWENDYEAFAKDCESWVVHGIIVKPYKIKGFCKNCKSWKWIVQRQAYSGFVLQCACGGIYAFKKSTYGPRMGEVHHFEKHFEDIEELGKYFNLEYYE